MISKSLICLWINIRPFLDVEWIDHVISRIGCPHPVMNMDEQFSFQFISLCNVYFFCFYSGFMVKYGVFDKRCDVGF